MSAAQVVGREAELASLASFLDAIAPAPSALILEGEPGIGKTTLWSHALAVARERSFMVLACRPDEAESSLSFSALADLFGDVIDESLSSLPSPQQRAVRVAMLQEDFGNALVDQRALSVAFLGITRVLAGTAPIVIGIDDVQWLDPPSARVLTFVLRRLNGDRVKVLASLRTRASRGALLDLDRALGPERLRRLSLGPLTIAEIDALFTRRLGSSFAHRTLRKIYQVSGGNPFFCLEIARYLAREEVRAESGRPLPVPDNLTELVTHRIAALPLPAQDVLLAAAALSRPKAGTVRAALGEEATLGLTQAADAGLIVFEDDRVLFTHPLLAAASYQLASPQRRREVHHHLADVVTEPEERARHLALASTSPDERVATVLDEGARLAAGRGAPDAAGELSELAAHLTPADNPEYRWGRLVNAAEHLLLSGDAKAGQRHLRGVIDDASPGPVRARALWLLGRWEADQRQGVALFNEALSQAGEDPGLEARIHFDLADAYLMSGAIASFAPHVRAAMDLAKAAEDLPLMCQATLEQAAVHWYRDGALRLDLFDRAITQYEQSNQEDPRLDPRRLRGVWLVWWGDHRAGRRDLEPILERARRVGDEETTTGTLATLGIADWMAGDWPSAAKSIDQAALWARQMYPWGEVLDVYRSFIESSRGRTELAQSQALELLASAADRSDWQMGAAASSTLGFIELSLGNHARAHDFMGPVVGRCEALGVRSPRVLRFIPDEVEALVALGMLRAAKATLEPFEENARALPWPWGVATSGRCRALILAALGDLTGAIGALDDSLNEHRKVPEPFQRARTLLVMGQVQRRMKHKGAARRYLQEALSVFESLGAPLWAGKASVELSRIGGRAPGPAGLTPTERRVAACVGEGMANREIASALFMAVSTVEWNLTRIYRKLGVSSRAELIVRMQEGEVVIDSGR